MKDWFLIRWFIFILIPITSAIAQDGYIQGLPNLAYWQVGTSQKQL